MRFVYFYFFSLSEYPYFLPVLSHPFHDPRMMIPCDGIPVAFGISKTWFSVFIDGEARTFCRARHVFVFLILFALIFDAAGWYGALG